jgi:asparagine synthetase B (glutamine-hydrolysing)
MLSVSSEAKAGPGFEKKRLLKETYRGRIPDEILDGKKVGFSSPLHLWIDERFKRVSKAILVEQRSPCFERCNRTLTERFVDGCDTNWKYAEYVYGMLAYATWHKLHIEQAETHMPSGSIEECWAL